MTVSTAYAPLTFAGNDATTAFAVTWPFFTGTLVVTLVDSDGVETTKTITTHYTVSGGTDSDGLPSTGTVTMLTAPATGETLRITRATTVTQASTWGENDAFPQATVEAALDKLTLIAQETADGAADDITGDVMRLNSAGATDYWDAESQVIRNVADAVNSTDAINYGQFQDAVLAVGSGDVVGPGGATNNQVVLFDSTTGKLIKAATTTGLLKASSGVLAQAVAGTDYVTPTGLTSGSAVQKADGAGGLTAASANVDYGEASIAAALAQQSIVVNGEMRISQQNGTTAGTATSYYPADQWYMEFSNAGAFSVQQVTDAPVGYTNSIKLTVSTADASVAAGDYLYLSQKIEGTRIDRLGFGSSGANTATLGFWVKSSLTGTHGVAFQNATPDQSFLASYTISSADTWEFKAVSISARETGTWVTSTSQGAKIVFSLMAGATYQGSAGWNAANYTGISGQTNVAGTTSATFAITGVVLLPGTHTLTSGLSSLMQRHYNDELRICQRYYAKTYPVAKAPGSVADPDFGFTNVCDATTTYLALPVWFYPAKMRATPTVTGYSPTTGTSAKARNTNAGADVTVAVATYENCCGGYVDNVSVSAQQRIGIHYVANARM